MKFSFTKNPESDFFYKDSKSNKNNLEGSGGWEERGGSVARVSDFSQKNPSLKKKCLKCFLSEGVKVREDWLV